MFHPQSIAGMDHMMQVFFLVLNMTSIYLHGHNYESFNSGNFFCFSFAEMVIDLYYKSVAASLVSVILQTKEGKNSSLILKNCPNFFSVKLLKNLFCPSQRINYLLFV